MIGKDIRTHQIGGPMIAAPSGKIANSRGTIIDGTNGKTQQVTSTTSTIIKTGSVDPKIEPTGTKISLASTMISDVVIGHINMDTSDNLQIFVRRTAVFNTHTAHGKKKTYMCYLDDFSPTIVLQTVSTIALLSQWKTSFPQSILACKGPRKQIYNSCNGRSKKHILFSILQWEQRVRKLLGI